MRWHVNCGLAARGLCFADYSNFMFALVLGLVIKPYSDINLQSTHNGSYTNGFNLSHGFPRPISVLRLISFRSMYSNPNEDQVFLWPNETTNPRTQLNTPFNYSCTLPVAYSLSYQRSLALSSFYLVNTMDVGFTANIVLSSTFN